MRGSRRRLLVLVLPILGSLVAASAAAEPHAREFRRGRTTVTPLVGGGFNNFEQAADTSRTFIPALTGTVRFATVPRGPAGSGPWRGVFEAALEPWLQYYPAQEAVATGAKLGIRWHFLRTAPVLPFVEGLVGLGLTGLDVTEIDSDFTFVEEVGAGVVWLPTRELGVTVGWRFQHVSNAGIDEPNRGVNTSVALLGITLLR